MSGENFASDVTRFIPDEVIPDKWLAKKKSLAQMEHDEVMALLEAQSDLPRRPREDEVVAAFIDATVETIEAWKKIAKDLGQDAVVFMLNSIPSEIVDRASLYTRELVLGERQPRLFTKEEFNKEAAARGHEPLFPEALPKMVPQDAVNDPTETETANGTV